MFYGFFVYPILNGVLLTLFFSLLMPDEKYAAM